MTPAQKSALEALNGAALTSAQEAAIVPLLAAGNHAGIAHVLSLGRVKIASREIGDGALCIALGDPDGPVLMLRLQLIAQTPITQTTTEAEFTLIARVQQALRSLARVGFDVGSTAVRESLDGFVGSLLTQAQADALKALAEQPDPIQHEAVSAALRGVA